MKIRILLPSGKVKIMELEDYLLRVVPAEMPASWPVDALKAQAVAARTYAVQKIMRGGKHKLEGADVCTRSHCQNYLERPPKEQHSIDAISRAVTETAGIILTYNDQVIDAVYHSSCGGYTASALEVWRNEVPYLISVDCPCGKRRNGHGVGLCQYGAKAMATPDCVGNSCDWQAILAYYYRGAKLAGTNEIGVRNNTV